jgi:tripartite-type tricarboxylate transporter receptor subunit TctC
MVAQPMHLRLDRHRRKLNSTIAVTGLRRRGRRQQPWPITEIVAPLTNGKCDSFGLARGHIMKLLRRTFLRLAGVTVIAPVISSVATAQTYPTRPITMIVPAPAGGPTDAIARVVVERMGRSLRQPIVIENVTGRDGNIGTGRVAHARPDGYTIAVGLISTHVFNGAFYSLPYDVLKDFAPISPLAMGPSVLFAGKAFPAKDLNELIAWLKANPNKASAAIASSNIRLLTTVFQKETGTHFTLVSYRGAAPAMQDLVAGQIDLAFGPPDQSLLARAGSIKAYAVASDTRLALAPEIATFAEVGFPAISWSNWYGLFAPKGTARDIIGKLNAAVVEALADPAVRPRLVELGAEIFPREEQTPEALGALQKADADKWFLPISVDYGRTPRACRAIIGTASPSLTGEIHHAINHRRYDRSRKLALIAGVHSAADGVDPRFFRILGSPILARLRVAAIRAGAGGEYIAPEANSRRRRPTCSG